MEDDIFAEYENEIRSMTFKQGRILIKLIDREAGSTSYTILEELKGKSSAVFWQAIARIFGSNLNWEYDPVEERAIEEIIKSIWQLPVFYITFKKWFIFVAIENIFIIFIYTMYRGS